MKNMFYFCISICLMSITGTAIIHFNKTEKAKQDRKQKLDDYYLEDLRYLSYNYRQNYATDKYKKDILDMKIYTKEDMSKDGYTAGDINILEQEAIRLALKDIQADREWEKQCSKWDKEEKEESEKRDKELDELLAEEV